MKTCAASTVAELRIGRCTSGYEQIGPPHGKGGSWPRAPVDGAGVNGAARGARALGWIGSRLQTGQVGLYVTLFVVGVLAILWRVAG